MSNKINDGGPAFPSHLGMSPGMSPGMSLRDWFAAMATEGEVVQIQTEWMYKLGKFITKREARYRHADAMLVEREKE
jgi:hypothetical protein